MIWRRQRVSLHPSVSPALTAAARRSEPKETGGLLIGWLDDGAIVVRHILEVLDPDAAPTSWTRSETRANQALTQFLAEAEHPWLGYVGDWHTHPAPIGASQTDRRTLRKDSRTMGHPLVLIVHRTDETLDVVTAHRGLATRTNVTKYRQNDPQESAD